MWIIFLKTVSKYSIVESTEALGWDDDCAPSVLFCSENKPLQNRIDPIFQTIEQRIIGRGRLVAANPMPY